MAATGRVIGEDDELPLNKQFHRGSIVRLAMENFMVHKSVELKPGARMNLVLGPNGSGKSTLVCAFCLVFNGSPKIVARGDNLSEFVKHGEEVASIEVELFDEERGNQTITRTIHKSSNKSTWHLNKSATSGARITELVASYNIDVSNLCAFLPQELMGKLSTLNGKELLEQVEKAAGQGVVDAHKRAVELQSVQSAPMQIRLESLRSDVEQVKAELDSLEKYRQALQDREAAEKLLKLLQAKMLWVKYQNLRLASKDAESKAKESKEQLQQARDAKRAIEQEKSFVEATLQTSQQLIDKTTQQILSLNKQREASVKEVQSRSTAAEGLRSEIEQLDAARDTAKKMLLRAQDVLNDTKAKLDALPAVDERDRERVNEERRNLTAQLNEIQDSRAPLAEQLRTQTTETGQHQKRLQQLQNVIARKHEAVRAAGQNGQKALRAHEWVQSNKSKFRGPVFGPIALELDLEPAFRNLTQAVENCLPFWVLMGFVVTCRADMETLRDGTGNSVDIIIQEAVEDFRPFSHPELKAAGIHGCLTDIVVADPLVKSVIAGANCVGNSLLVGGEDAARRCDTTDFLQTLPREFRAVITPRQQYSIMSSKYSSSRTTTNRDYERPARFLSPTPDEAEIKSVERDIADSTAKEGQIKKQIDQLEAQRRTVNEQLRALDDRLKEHMELVRQRGKLQTQLKAHERAVQDAAAEANKDTHREEQRILQAIMKTFADRQRGILKAAELSGKIAVLLVESQTAQAKLMVAKSELAQFGPRLRQAEGHINELQKECDILQKQHSELKEAARAAYDVATREAPIFVGKDPNRPLPLKDQLEALPYASEAEIQEKMEEQEAIIRRASGNQEMIRHYDKVRTDYETKSRDLAKLEREFSNVQQELAAAKEAWEKVIEQYVLKIDLAFHRYFGTIGCEGHCKLNKTELYADYALNIMVSFRKGTAPQVLSGITQSGGERAVSTMMFLLALQSVIPCPFRIVDEMNQGMDANNERATFKTIVETCGVATSQYFVITPKLLSNLEYAEHVVTHVILNGNGLAPDLKNFEHSYFVQLKRYLAAEALQTSAAKRVRHG